MFWTLFDRFKDHQHQTNDSSFAHRKEGSNSSSFFLFFKRYIKKRPSSPWGWCCKYKILNLPPERDGFFLPAGSWPVYNFWVEECLLFHFPNLATVLPFKTKKIYSKAKKKIDGFFNEEKTSNFLSKKNPPTSDWQFFHHSAWSFSMSLVSNYIFLNQPSRNWCWMSEREKERKKGGKNCVLNIKQANCKRSCFTVFFLSCFLFSVCVWDAS